MARRRKKPKEHEPLSREALELVARRFRALSEPTRLQLLQALFGGERTVQDLCEEVGTGQANVSKHLKLLTDEGILSRRREGLYAYYRIVDPTVRDLCELVCGALAERFERVPKELRV